MILGREIAAKKERPERVLQFGEGVFLRAFADELFDRLNESGLFDGSIVVVPPTPRGSAEPLNRQDGLYTVLLRGLLDGRPVSLRRVITSISRAVNAYTDYETYIACAKNPDLRFVISNTTEAGIVFDDHARPDDRPPAGFPAKVAAFLYERFRYFEGDARRGLIFLPCELVDRNGSELRACVLRHADAWRYCPEFAAWVDSACLFLDTLVDRIVSGYPEGEADALAAEFGYEDALLDCGEPFHFWAIELPTARSHADTPVVAPSDTPVVAPAEPLPAEPSPVGSLSAGARPFIASGGDIDLPALLPFHKIGLNVLYSDDIAPYRQRKVRLLNGAHTSCALAAFLAGKDTVGQAVGDPLFLRFLKRALFDEIIPTLDLDRAELTAFAASVLERFANPYVRHSLTGIALNSTSKFKVRVLPSILEYHRRADALPAALVFSFAALLAYYRVGRRDGSGAGAGAASVPAYYGERAGEAYEVKDDESALAFFAAAWTACDLSREGVHGLVRGVCARESLWGADLNALPGFAAAAADALSAILRDGVAAALAACMK
ncbi:MAG: tagaturonate reductase [Clostridiales bacterium]|jgi:tagaturonate reductase|nr:tagaturonate reductase [Clostridiales bacterium]